MLAEAGVQPEKRPTQILQTRNKEQYTGEWYGSKRHGRGKMVLLDGSTYEGYWLNDMMNGYGRYMPVEGGDQKHYCIRCLMMVRCSEYAFI